MKIELKNIKVAMNLSRETNAFTADVYVEGKKIAWAENDGHGGMTNVQPYNGKDYNTFNDAKAFCEAMPKKKLTHNGHDLGDMDITLDTYVDDIVDEFINKREKDKFEKKYQKAMLNGIVVGNPDKTESFDVYKLQQPLTAYQPKVLLEYVEKLKAKLKEGERILNTNLPTA